MNKKTTESPLNFLEAIDDVTEMMIGYRGFTKQVDVSNTVRCGLCEEVINVDEHEEHTYEHYLKGEIK